MLRSTDGGQSYDSTAFTDTDSIAGIAVGTSGRLYVASGDQVSFSVDGGATFTSVTPYVGIDVQIRTIEAHPANPLEAWIGYTEAGTIGTVARTVDGGLTWTDVTPASMTGPCTAIAFDAAQPQRIALLRRSFFAFVSTDGGVTWSSSAYTNAGDVGTDVAFVGGNLVLSTTFRVVTSSDMGTSWTNVPLPPGLGSSLSIQRVASIEADPSVAGRAILASNSLGAFESTDSGVSWAPIGGLESAVECVAFGPAGALVVGTPYGLLQGPGGTSFQAAALTASAAALEEPLSVVDLALDGTSVDRMAAILRAAPSSEAFFNGPVLATTDDGGTTWSFDRSLGREPLSLEYDPSGVLYAGVVRPFLPGASSGLLRRATVNGWVDVGPPDVAGTVGYPNGIAVDPRDANALFLVTSSNTPGVFGTDLTLWRSLDRGQSWTEADSVQADQAGGPSEITIVAGGAGGASRVAYVQRTSSSAFPGSDWVRVSDDGGLTWTGGIGASYFDAAFLHIAGDRSTGRLYAAITNPTDPRPVQISDDGGQTWSSAGENLERYEDFAVSQGEDGVLYLASFGGAERATYGGATRESFASVTGDVADVRIVTDSTNGDSIVAYFGESGVWRLRVPATAGTSYCGPAVPNASGVAGQLRLEGSPSVSANALTLIARRLPANTLSLAVVADAPGFVVAPGGSLGNLCVGGAIGRYTPFAAAAGPDGRYELPLDLGALPRPGGTTPAMPGQTVYYQAWFRDQAPGGMASSNFTDAVSVTFDA